MRRGILSLGAALAIVLLMPKGEARAQAPGFGSDPFQLYYGWYLPNQMYQAQQPTPMDSINQQSMRRQSNIQAERSGLYDPVSPFGEDELDPLSPYAPRRPAGRSGPLMQNTARTAFQDARTLVARGGGTTVHFNRLAGYYAEHRIGRGPNRNIPPVRQRPGGFGGGGGMGGMPGMPSMPSAPSMPGR